MSKLKKRMSWLNEKNAEFEKRRWSVKTTIKLNFDRKNAPYARTVSRHIFSSFCRPESYHRPVVSIKYRELKQTTTTTATRTSLNKNLMSRTIAVHVRYKSLYISLPSSAKQQREMTNF